MGRQLILDVNPVGQVPVTFTDGSIDEVLSVLSRLREASAIAIDTETVYDGNDQVTFTREDGKEVTYKRDLSVDGPGAWRVLQVAARFGKGADATYQVWVVDVSGLSTELLAPLFKASPRPYAYNAPFDQGVLARGGIQIRRWWDVMLFDSDLRCGANGSDTSRYLSLARVAKRELGVEMEGKNTTRLSYDASTPLTEEQVRYAALDALVTLLLGDILGARLRSLDLVETMVRDCNAQPLIDGMTRSGLPIDVEGYLKDIVHPAEIGAAAAAERLAVLTTGGELLETIHRWAVSTKRTPEGSDPVEVGLMVLHDELGKGAFDAFVKDVEAQAANAKELVAKAAGGGVVEEDLFSDGPSLQSPFVIDDDTDVRRWLSKAAPTFASCVVVASLDPSLSFEDIETRAKDLDWLNAASAGKKRLVKDHDLDGLVLPRLAVSSLGEVTPELKALAKSLGAYRRYRRLLDTYGAQIAPVRLVPDWKLSAPEQVKNMLNTYAEAEVREHFRKAEGADRLLGKADSVDSDKLTLVKGELATALLTWRSLEKVKSTYGEEFLKYVHPVTGRIHARYKQSLTGTGRLSSESPNAQNLPPKAKPYLRPVLVDGKVRRVLVCSDLSQAELRYVADQAGDENMLGAFASGQDLHERTASLMFNLDLKQLKSFGETPIRDIPAMVMPDLAAYVALDAEDERKAQLEGKSHTPLHADVLYKALRHKAKRVGFGYAYGLKGAGLAQGLTVDGVPTSKEEADELLRRFDQAYPQVAAWMASRVAQVEAIADEIQNSETLDVDFEASWKLHLTFGKVREATNSLKSTLGYLPSSEEVSEKLVSDDDIRARINARTPTPSSDEVESLFVQERAKVTDQVAWASAFDHAVVLRKDGSAWMFSSRTAGNRVRWFPILTADWEWGMVQSIARSRDGRIVSARDQWVARYNDKARKDAEEARAAGKRKAASLVSLTKQDRRSNRLVPLFGKELEKQFEDRARRTELVRWVLANCPDRATRLFRAAMADRVKALINQFRNQPVQGGVADAMLVAMSEIDMILTDRFPTARVIQSVHDSLVVECDVEDAIAIRSLLKSKMEEGLSVFCPGVLAKADADIQLSLDDHSKLTDEKVAELAQAWGRQVVSA